ncbi:ATP-binding protein [Cellulomonas sp. S1-8]|uniref:ATP-binding protein n=1 Tax=Cellulomonas sp. S1-8 TaxID=2904790 RepID=UPI00224435FD|nr:ATP-binding protein [Cellulomonas sp. S1-8]UZN03380.1 ATP-binding protein [Cellulomonas sp. S1-8]
MEDWKHLPLDLPGVDAGLPLSQPPAGYELVREWALSTTAQLRTLRHELASQIAEHEVGGLHELTGTPKALVLIATELASNALVHGLPPTMVRLSRREDRWMLDVGDHDPESAPVYAGARIRGEGGLGLHLARQLSQEVGWYATERTKNVWATFAVR